MKIAPFTLLPVLYNYLVHVGTRTVCVHPLSVFLCYISPQLLSLSPFIRCRQRD